MATDATTTLDVFDRAWDQLAAQGRCDARGSMEYVRIRGQWDRLMGLMYAVDFIAHTANQLPEIPPLELPPLDLPDLDPS